jgi:hypothetical protein
VLGWWSIYRQRPRATNIIPPANPSNPPQSLNQNTNSSQHTDTEKTKEADSHASSIRRPTSPLTAVPGGPVLASPDPYVGKDDRTVAEWAMKKADDMLMFYASCSNDITQGMKNKNDGKPLTLGHLGPDAMARPYLNAWSQKDRDDVGNLHQSLLSRLGPDSEGESSFKALAIPFPAGNAASQGFFLCNAVNDYIPHLRKMGEKLMAQFRESTATPLTPLSSLTDGQRFVIKKKLEHTEGNSIRLVIVGTDPKSVVLYNQMMDIFNSVRWRIQATQVGLVGATGAFPSTPYVTGKNIASPILKQVFSAFDEVGVNLPLVPDALTFDMGREGVDVVIVVH